MKKLVATMIVAMVASVFTPIVPQAHAAVLEDKLAQAVEQGVTASRIQDLLKVKQELDKGNKDAVISTIAALAQERIAKSNINSIAANSDVKQVMGNALRQQVEQKVSEQLGPIQNQLNLLAVLLNGQSSLTPSTVRESNSLTGAPENYKRVLDMTATAYAPGPLDNGKWNNQSYVGGIVKKGVVAVDPNVIPMGTKLWVEGYGEAVADDQGSAIKGNRIDLAFNDRQEALDYGIQKIKVYVLN